MYGKWFLFAFGFAAVALLAIALIATAYAPIFAVAIALLVAIVVLIGRAGSRTEQVGSEPEVAAEERRQAGQTQRETAGAGPASGEGQAAQAQRAARTTGGPA